MMEENITAGDRRAENDYEIKFQITRFFKIKENQNLTWQYKILQIPKQLRIL